MMSMTRRQLLNTGASVAALLGFGCVSLMRTTRANAETFEVTHTDAEWRKLLTSEQFDVLRREGTESPGSSPLNHEKREGLFSCAGCQLPLFSSKTKFDSGTGWPSFWKPLDHAVVERKDSTFGMTRTEIHCRRCGGHLGHVFDDGPQPTGLRYCMDGVAMLFSPTTA